MIFFRNKVNPKNSAEILFEALENDACCGECTLIFDNGAAVVTSIEFDEDKPYIADGLIKSAFNFATTKNYYMGYCKCKNYGGFLDRMNLEVKGGVYYNDIPSILQGNCCKKH